MVEELGIPLTGGDEYPIETSNEETYLDHNERDINGPGIVGGGDLSEKPVLIYDEFMSDKAKDLLNE